MPWPGAVMRARLAADDITVLAPRTRRRVLRALFLDVSQAEVLHFHVFLDALRATFAAEA